MKRVLIVDDAAFMRVSIKNMLTKNGFEVVGEAENGKVAVAKFQELAPDIVTMDITMPEMDGLAALKEIMKLNSGAKGFIVKPFKEDVILSAFGKFA